MTSKTMPTRKTTTDFSCFLFKCPYTHPLFHARLRSRSFKSSSSLSSSSVIVLNMLDNAMDVDTPTDPPSEARTGLPSTSPNSVGDFIDVIKYCCANFCSNVATTAGCCGGRHPLSKPMWISLMCTLSPRPTTTGGTNASKIAWDACAQDKSKSK